MKRISSMLALIALCVMVVVSCKKDDAPATPAYIGSWLETHFNASGCTDSGDDEDHSCTSGTCETIIIATATITFVKPGSSNEVVNYTASGTTFTITKGSDTITATVVVSGTTLTLTFQNSVADGGCLNVNTYSKI